MHVVNRKDSTQLILDVLDAREESFNTNKLSGWRNSQVFAVKKEVERVLGENQLIQANTVPGQRNLLETYDGLSRREQREVRKEVLQVLTDGRETHVTIQSLPSVVASIETL